MLYEPAMCFFFLPKNIILVAKMAILSFQSFSKKWEKKSKIVLVIIFSSIGAL